MSSLPAGLILRLLAGAIVVSVMFSAGRSCGLQDGRAEVAKLERAKAEQEVRLANEAAQAAKAAADRYIQRAEAANAAATQYQKALNDANRRADATVADLLAGNARLRRLWQGCEAVSAPGPAAADSREPQDRAELQAASLGRIDRAVSACQLHVTALLTLAECDRDPNRPECRP